MKKILLSLLILCGCTEATYVEAQTKELEPILTNDLRFMRHPNGFCLAYAWTRDGSGQAAVGGPIVFEVSCSHLAER